MVPLCDGGPIGFDSICCQNDAFSPCPNPPCQNNDLVTSTTIEPEPICSCCVDQILLERFDISLSGEVCGNACNEACGEASCEAICLFTTDCTVSGCFSKN